MLDPPVDPARDHVVGPSDAEMTLVQYGSYATFWSRSIHHVVEQLRSRFGDRMRYVYRHLPVAGNNIATRAAELAEQVAETTGQFWEVHEALMERGPVLSVSDLAQIAEQHQVALDGGANHEALAAAKSRVSADIETARRSGANEAPVFFINGRKYTGAWDESSLADAMLAPLGHRIQSAAFEFVRWGPSSGLLLGVATLFALVISNSPFGPAFNAWWETPLGFQWGDNLFAHSLLHWVNHGLLTIFFFVVGLEIKREFTVGHLATFRSGALPVIAAIGGFILPAVIYAIIAPPDLRHGWGIPIGTDTAFAVAIIVFLGRRVPVELRVFLTAAVIIDDIVAILVIALFYTEQIHAAYLVVSLVVAAMLLVFNRTAVYSTLPYAICGVLLWFFLHEAGLHATLAGVILALVIPARPPANLKALLAQASTIIHKEGNHTAEAMRSGPSEHALETLDLIHRRIESPADKLLRASEPWSSYVVLPIFALANAGVVWSPNVFEGQFRLIAAIAMGLVIGKPMGLIAAAWFAVKTGIANKPDAYSWRQLCGAGALGGIGFTMSLFIAGVAFPDDTVYAAAKIGIFVASLAAGGIGILVLWPKRDESSMFQ
ncbi:Na+/H+ antiporter NhaA [Aeoliella sp. SH292]|uniref:Na+/H+ antiporter NhaA n=1 Tax=Aeoliella sp. SH292 TaxID=3454464 RepID=UPI003F951671